MSEQATHPIFQAAGQVAQVRDTDVYFYSGEMNRAGVSRLIDEAAKAAGRTNATLVLTTYGGDPSAAYILARYMRRRYERFTLLVFGHCKSAGTLIALGAHEIAMSAHGELGPLDVQTIKEDTIGRQSSGLDIFQAVSIVTNQAITAFDDHFVRIIARSGGAITAKTAADIASSMAAQLLAPIAAQIDPLRLGEMQRAINIAQQYGERLGADPTTVQKLVTDYPMHGFVIDLEEAEGLFPRVREPEPDETALEAALREHLVQDGNDCVRVPHGTGLNGCLTPALAFQREMFDAESHDAASDAEGVGGSGGAPDSQSVRESAGDGGADPSEDGLSVAAAQQQRDRGAPEEPDLRPPVGAV
jgi:hypothetical protein